MLFTEDLTDLKWKKVNLILVFAMKQISLRQFIKHSFSLVRVRKKSKDKYRCQNKNGQALFLEHG